METKAGQVSLSQKGFRLVFRLFGPIEDPLPDDFHNFLRHLWALVRHAAISNGKIKLTVGGIPGGDHWRPGKGGIHGLIGNQIDVVLGFFAAFRAMALQTGGGHQIRIYRLPRGLDHSSPASTFVVLFHIGVSQWKSVLRIATLAQEYCQYQ